MNFIYEVTNAVLMLPPWIQIISKCFQGGDDLSLWHLLKHMVKMELFRYAKRTRI